MKHETLTKTHKYCRKLVENLDRSLEPSPPKKRKNQVYDNASSECVTATPSPSKKRKNQVYDNASSECVTATTERSTSVEEQLN